MGHWVKPRNINTQNMKCDLPCKDNFFSFQHTVDFSLSLVHLCIKSAIFTSTVPLMGVAGTNCPLHLMLETFRNKNVSNIIIELNLTNKTIQCSYYSKMIYISKYPSNISIKISSIQSQKGPSIESSTI